MELYNANFYNPYLLLVIAFIMIFFEFFLSGFVMGILGGIFVILSLVSFFLQGHPPHIMFAYFVFVVVSLIVLVRVTLKIIQKTGKKNTIMLDKNQEGYVATSFDKSLIGQTGVALTDLKPAGKVGVGEKEVQALSEMGYLPKGTKVHILRGAGSHLIVRKVE